MIKSDFDFIMELLNSAPGVKEHMESPKVKMGLDIFKQRIHLGWNQDKLIKECHSKGFEITKEQIAKMECGIKDVEYELYEKVYYVLLLK